MGMLPVWSCESSPFCNWKQRLQGETEIAEQTELAEAHSLCTAEVSKGCHNHLIQLENASCLPYQQSMRASYLSRSASPSSVHSSENAHSTILRLLLSTTHTTSFQPSHFILSRAEVVSEVKRCIIFKADIIWVCWVLCFFPHYASLLPGFIFTVPQHGSSS